MRCKCYQTSLLCPLEAMHRLVSTSFVTAVPGVALEKKHAAALLFSSLTFPRAAHACFFHRIQAKHLVKYG
jgi:hypothetical protein